MRWNWQQSDWPRFRFAADLTALRERAFLRQAGVVVGTLKHFADEERLPLVIELIGTEALKTSEIEGEMLDRLSVQSSLRRQFGLQSDERRSPPAEQGIAEVLGDLYRHFETPLDHATLCRWQGDLMRGRRDLDAVGAYRRHPEPMRVVSGRIDAPTVHFEAPPSDRVQAEMQAFVAWFNETAPGGSRPLPTLLRAGLAHLYFESIHPFEDGNGRVGRALSEKALAQGVGQPSLTALSLTIERHRKDYYAQLGVASRTLDVEVWLDWFADIVLEAQQHTVSWIDFLLAKSRLLDGLRGKINGRQEKALLRMLEEGPAGLRGGLSAGKYVALTGAAPATARRDLAELVEFGALRRTGELKTTRYWLAIDMNLEMFP